MLRSLLLELLTDWKLMLKISVIGVFTSFLLLLLFRGCNGWRRVGPPTPSPVVNSLPNNDEAKVYVTGNKLTVQTKEQTTMQYVPDHATVEIRKTGEVITHVQQIGWAKDWYVGLSMGDMPRAQIGLDWLYVNRFRLGMGLGVALEKPDNVLALVRPNVTLSYNVYRNTSVFLGADAIGGFLGGVQIKL